MIGISSWSLAGALQQYRTDVGAEFDLSLVHQHMGETKLYDLVLCGMWYVVSSIRYYYLLYEHGI